MEVELEVILMVVAVEVIKVVVERRGIGRNGGSVGG